MKTIPGPSNFSEEEIKRKIFDCWQKEMTPDEKEKALCSLLEELLSSLPASFRPASQIATHWAAAGITAVLLERAPILPGVWQKIPSPILADPCSLKMCLSN